MTVMYVYLW